MKQFTAAVRAAVAALLVAPMAQAQDAQWHYELSSYMWFPKSTTAVETPFGTAESELSVSDALKALDFGVMVTGTMRRGPWAFTGDLVHLKLTEDSPTPFGGLYSNLDTSIRLTALSGYAMYEVMHDPDTSLELGAGVRAVDSSVKLSFAAGALPASAQTITDTWIDPLLALRVKHRFDDHWNAAVSLDYGGFGIGESSDETLQAVAVAGYQFNDNWSMVAGYRLLYVDRSNAGTDYSLEMSGPVIGVTYSF